MEIETRMGFKVRSKYEDVVRWIQSDPPGVPYPKNRKELQAMDSHVYGQLTASLSTEATRTVADDFYRNRGGGGAANAERAALRQQLAKNPRLYEDKQGNIKAKRPAKSAHVGAKKSAKSASFSPERAAQGARPVDRYGVRRRAAAARGKSLGASASRSRERVGLVV